MKASLNWIKEFVLTDATPKEISDRLSMAGLEIEASQDLGAGLEQVYSATLLKREKHPNADRLSLCEVSVGEQPVQVVCGATNMKVGDKVALARPGARLPNGMKIKSSKIRQVRSDGMLCSETELGLASESAGIMILPQETPDGLPLQEALKLQDTLYEVNVTPNRGDCLSMQGLAREVAANFKLPFHSKEIKLSTPKVSKTVEVLNQAPELCPRYTCLVLRGVQIKASPPEVRQRLESCGIRAINNVVDISNYVMLETGQPLHAFDLKQIRGGQVQIRRANKGETLCLLDESEKKLSEDDLVIADAERVLALAGVMGGEDSGVSNQTVDLLLESAHFNPSSVRQTAKRHSTATESSYRFERFVDPNGCVTALKRFAEMIIKTAGGEIASEVVDVYPKSFEPIQVKLREKQIKRVLGVEIKADEFIPALEGLGISFPPLPKGEGWGEGTFLCQIPTFRSDLTREIDLIEEIARLYSYNRIPVSYPHLPMDQLQAPQVSVWDQIREQLVAWGFSEVLHYSFTSPEILKKFGVNFSEEQKLKNPLSEDLSILRSALFPQMLQTLQSNYFKGNTQLKFFEIRPIYLMQQDKIQETWHLCLGGLGPRQGTFFKSPPEDLGFLDFKGYLERLLDQILSSKLQTKPSDRSFLHPKRQASLRSIGGFHGQKFTDLGFLGQIHPKILADLDIGSPMVVAEINLDLFLTELKNRIQFKLISPFPRVDRDLNLVVDEGTSHGDLIQVMVEAGGPWVQKLELIDVYRGQPLAEGKKALTYRIEYGDPKRTLTDEEVNQAREKLLVHLKQRVGAVLR